VSFSGDQILGAMFSVMLVSGILSVVVYMRVLALMQSRHRQEWEGLGSPTIFANNSIGNSARFWVFNIRGRYRKLNDPELTRLFRWMNALSIVYGVFFGSFVALILTGVIRRAMG
jgi:hypothetical protein